MDLLKLQMALGDRRDDEAVTIPAGGLRDLLRTVEAQSDYADLQDEISELQRDLKDAEAAISGLEKDVETLERQLDDAEREPA